MSPTIAIRPAQTADVRDITAIYSHAVEHGTASFEIEPPSEAEMATRQKILLDGGFPYLVADAGGVIAGYAYAGPYRPRFAYRYAVEDSVYVHPRAARRGIGRMLLNALIAEAQARGFRQMVAVIGDSAQTASIELHRALGFAEVGTLAHIGFKHGRWLDSVLMQRALGEGAETLP
jgi:phosphinothricin acetyltransferase